MSRYYHTSQRIVIEPYLATNPRAVEEGMSLATTVAKDPRPTKEYGCNTTARLVTLGHTGYKDYTDVWYDRTDIDAMFTASGITDRRVERPSDAVTTHDLIPEVNRRFRLQLVPQDVTEAPVSMTDTHVTLEMSPESVAWLGQITLQYITVMDYPHRITRSKLPRITRDGKVRMTRVYQDPDYEQ